MLELVEAQDVALIGTVYKDMKMKPSILDEYTKVQAACAGSCSWWPTPGPAWHAAPVVSCSQKTGEAAACKTTLVQQGQPMACLPRDRLRLPCATSSTSRADMCSWPHAWRGHAGRIRHAGVHPIPALLPGLAGPGSSLAMQAGLHHAILMEAAL